MQRHSENVEFGNRPDGISAVPRPSEHGIVVDEVGVLQLGTGKDYWKVIQRIEESEEDGSNSEVRVGYYARSDDEWLWSQRHMKVEPEILNQLYSRAVTEGIMQI